MRRVRSESSSVENSCWAALHLTFKAFEGVVQTPVLTIDHLKISTDRTLCHLPLNPTTVPLFCSRASIGAKLETRTTNSTQTQLN